ncbi:hypothetical protein ACFQ08_00475 [Streptosporangium algeriense]|uniref:Uncharacterized protein n=1 Tax=Streptosporangium algeriense TaxID=1682748 RepID=A0ABW3DGN5_9ACTN
MTDDQDTPPVDLVPQRWQCCDCGGTGLDGNSQTCDLCEGLGFC